MKRFAALFLVLVLMLSVLAGCGKTETPPAGNGGEEPGGEEKVETKVLRLAEVHPEGYPTTVADKAFAEMIKERTEGRYEIEVYTDSQLGDEKSVTEQIQFGSLEFGRLSLSPITEFEESLNILMLPYLYRDKYHMFNVVDGEIGDELLEKLEANSGLVGLAWFDAGSRNFYNSKREIKSPEDMKGLKIRVQETELMLDLVEALGANATPLAYAEVYSGLQTGVIEGAENNWPSYDSQHHYEVAKYFTLDEHTRVPELILTSKKFMDSLSDEDKAIFKQAAKEAGEIERTEWEKYEKESEQRVKDGGAIITYLDSNEAFQEKVKPLYDKFGKGYEELIQRILDTK